MSTASDGYRRDSQDFRQKYKEAKQKLATMDKKLLDSTHEIHALSENYSASKAEVLHLQNMLATNRANGRDHVDHHHRRNSNAFQEFEKVMAFLENSLQVIPPTGNENTIQSRLLTIINHLSQKEIRFAEENQNLRAQLEKLSKASSEANNPLEATLTRVMKQHEVEMSTIRAEIELTKDQYKQAEATWRRTKTDLEQRVDRLRMERNTAESNLREARSKEVVLSTELARAEKAKNSMMSSRDSKAEELAKLQKEYNEKLQSSRADQNRLNRVQSELEELKRRQIVDRGQSRNEDTEALHNFSDQLQSVKSQLSKSEQSNKEKNDTIAHLKTRIATLQDDISEGLKQLGKLQEEIAGKDLLLANARSASAGLESTSKLAMRERDAAIQRTNLEINVWKNKLTTANSTNDERLKEIDFLKASISVLEKKNHENSIARRKELDASRQKDNQVVSLQSKLAVMENQLETSRKNEISYKQDLDDYQMKIFGTSPADMKKIKAIRELRNRIYKIIDRQTIGNLVNLEEENRQLTVDQVNEELLLLNRILVERMEAYISTQNTVGNSEGVNNEDKEKIVKMEQEIEDITKTLSKEREEHKQLQVVIKEWRASNKPRSEPIEDKMAESGAELTSIAGDKDPELNIPHILAIALARTSTLEELVISLEEEVVQLKRVYDELVAIEQEMKGTIDSMENEISSKNIKIKHLERDLNNRAQDLAVKIDELVDVKSKLHEQSSKSEILEEERNDLKRHIDLLEKLKAEQQEQLEGRERALKRLDDARRTYERMYESKIETLKEERTVTEKTALAEFTKIQTEHELELQDTILVWNNKLAQTRVKHDTTLEAYMSDKAAVELEREELIKKVAELNVSLQKSIKDVEERNLLLSGYMALVSEKEATGGMLQEDSQAFQNLLEQRRLDMDTIAELTEETQKLKQVMDNQYNLMRQYDQNMTSLANSNELFIQQRREREQELIMERNARLRDQNQFKALLAERDKAIITLENAISRIHGTLKETGPTFNESLYKTPSVPLVSTHEANVIAVSDAKSTPDAMSEENSTSTIAEKTNSPSRATTRELNDMDLDL